MNRISWCGCWKFFVVALLVCTPLAAMAADVKQLEIGAVAPDFDLPGVDGKNHTLKEYAGSKYLLVLFTCNHCPTAQAYEARIKQLHSDYKDRGLQIVAISPNDPKAVRLDELGYTDLSDSLPEMVIRAQAAGFEFPYLYDGETQQVSHAYGAIATPHVFLFDQDRKLRYNGRIDDAEVGEVKIHSTRDAIESLLGDRDIAVKTTKVFGCSVKWAEKSASADDAKAKADKEPVELKDIDAAGIRELVANKTDKYRVINLWATWCGPCVHEMPALIDINRMYRKRPFEMITISVDLANRKDLALETLQEKHASVKNYISTVDKDTFAEAFDPKWLGPVPYTIVIAPGGEVIYRQQEEIDVQALKTAIVDKLGRTYESNR